MAHGQGKYDFRKGDSSKDYPYYEGTFEKGIRSGQGQFHYSATSSLKINWKNGKPDGNGTLKMGTHSQAVYFQSGARLLSRASFADV